MANQTSAPCAAAGAVWVNGSGRTTTCAGRSASEVWIAEDLDHTIHFNGERFLEPYPDVMPTNSPGSVPK